MSVVDTLTRMSAAPPEEVSSGLDGTFGQPSNDGGGPQKPDLGGSKWDDVYAAETFGEGIRAVFRIIPFWVPIAGVTSGIGAYYLVFRVRLFLSQWRIAERQRAERKFDLLENLRGVSMGPVGAVEPLADDGDPDEDEEEEDDETAVSMYDVDEFRSSLGIRLPRDEDLLVMVEKMLMVDPIPDGWVLYRTTAGIIRFMNLNTQELFFFHPGKRKEKAFIEEELKRRNRQAMESKYSFSYEDEGMNSFSVPTRPNNARTAGHSAPSPIDFGDDGAAAEEDESQNSTFKRMFSYFLEKEQKKIEQDVAKSRSTAASRTGGVSSSVSTPLDNNTPLGGHYAAAAAVAAASQTQRVAGSPSASAGRQSMASSTYRVVASSAIHGSRGASVKN